MWIDLSTFPAHTTETKQKNTMQGRKWKIMTRSEGEPLRLNSHDENAISERMLMEKKINSDVILANSKETMETETQGECFGMMNNKE